MSVVCILRRGSFVADIFNAMGMGPDDRLLVVLLSNYRYKVTWTAL